MYLLLLLLLLLRKEAALISFNEVRNFPTHRFNLDLTVFVIRVWLWQRMMPLLNNNMAFHFVMKREREWERVKKKRKKERNGNEKGNIGLSATWQMLIDITCAYT